MSAIHEPLKQLRQRTQAELLNDILPFWAKNAFDEKGWMTGVLAHDLRRFDDVQRHVVLCSRILWTFSAAQRVFPNEAWLATGRKALALLDGPFRDGRNGGVFWSLNPDGSVAADRKQIYAEAFTIYGLSEWYLATGDKAALASAIALFELIEKHAAEPLHGGYLEALAADWTQLEDMRLSPRDMNAPKSMNTLLHVLEAYTNLYRAWPEPRLRESLSRLLNVMLNHVVTHSPFTRCALFFDLEWRSLNDIISYGHDIEASWLLWEAAKALGDKGLLERTRSIALEMAAAVLLNGMDTDGSMFYSGTAQGVLNSDKHWWPQAEAVVGFLNAHQLTGDPAYATAAIRAWDFIESKVVDPVKGEWFAVLERSGKVLPDYPEVPDSCKIGPWKCPYHNARACLEVQSRIAV